MPNKATHSLFLSPPQSQSLQWELKRRGLAWLVKGWPKSASTHLEIKVFFFFWYQKGEVVAARGEGGKQKQPYQQNRA